MKPSVQLLWEQKLYSLVSAPLGVILKIAPSPLAPPAGVVRYKSPFVAGPVREGETTVKAAAVPLKLTLVVPDSWTKERSQSNLPERIEARGLPSRNWPLSRAPLQLTTLRPC